MGASGILKKLPLEQDIESKKILKKLTSTHRALAELKGIVSSIPNENILINTLGLQEAKDSSAIENIITTTFPQRYKIQAICLFEEAHFQKMYLYGFKQIKIFKYENHFDCCYLYAHLVSFPNHKSTKGPVYTRKYYKSLSGW